MRQRYPVQADLVLRQHARPFFNTLRASLASGRNSHAGIGYGRRSDADPWAHGAVAVDDARVRHALYALDRQCNGALFLELVAAASCG